MGTVCALEALAGHPFLAAVAGVRFGAIATRAGLVLIPVGFVLAAPLGWIGAGLVGLGAGLRLVLAWAGQDEANYARPDWDTSR